MAVRAAVKRVFERWKHRGDAAQDAVKAVRYYADVTGSRPERVADFADAVAVELGELARALRGGA